ncbi:MAG: hypothetical protein PUI48_02330 [Oscillospiraceae bacterium]|nr:hypothetical protein [Oscillospiraceae bacterium]MDY3791417.1 hypothetical protein [Oscillospiraceae bacterium]MDY6207655.1 hypothetical protein [Oscillospiraceae bacterium]
MNMKKSIAGVMAGAMAVSAMATVVSADQDAISLTYDLKTYVRDANKTSAKVTVVANYEGSLISADSIKDRKITFGANNKYVTGGKIYNSSSVVIGDAATGVAGMSEFEFTARPYKDNVLDVEEKYQTFKATGNANATDGSWYTPSLCSSSIDTNKKTFDMPIAIPGDSTKDKFDLSKYDLLALGYSTEEATDAIGYKLADVKKNNYGVRDAVAKMTYMLPNVVTLNKANGWGWNSDLSLNQAHGVGHEFFDEIDKTCLYGEVTMSAEVFAGGFFDINKTKNSMVKSNTTLISEPTTIAVGAFTAGASEEAVWPFKTTLKPSTTSNYVKKTGNAENNVIDALSSRKAGGNYYTKPVAVLNDAIANHDNVVFTFTSYNGYVATERSHLLNQWVNIDQGYSYKTSDYDWYNPTFSQHLYQDPVVTKNGYSAFDSDEFDMYGSYSSAWGINLFTGAVVVNSHLTMQLSDTDTFNWGNNTLSFDWFDITDEGKITDAKTFLTSMLLYTPVDWYWDSLSVVVSDEEDEDIDVGEGLDGEGEVIDDEEPVEDPEIVEDPEVVEEPEVTEAAPVETAPSPATGNAPVALAVIPVALAAAAVVAKKRG